MTRHAKNSVPALVSGSVLLLAGVFGVHRQGSFWASGVGGLNPGEVALALGLPAGVTLAGAFLVSYVLLASPLTAHWIPRNRTLVFAAVALGVLIACGTAAWLAGHVVARTPS